MARNSYSKDFHAILGVDEKAGPDELRRVYLALVVKYHPDRNPGDPTAEERFKDISQAYAVLSDPAARARYERLRPKSEASKKSRPQSSAAYTSKEGFGGQDKGSASGPAGSGSRRARPGPSAEAGQSKAEPGPEPSGADFDDIMADFFKSDKGRDTLRDLESALKKAGLNFKVEDFTRWFKDRRKNGSETSPGLWRRLMARLPGAEARARKKAELYDIQYQLSLSPQMAADGTTVEISYWRDELNHQLKIKVPAGTKDGTRLRLSGQGRLKPDQSRGDLMLTILVGQTQTVADLWK